MFYGIAYYLSSTLRRLAGYQQNSSNGLQDGLQNDMQNRAQNCSENCSNNTTTEVVPTILVTPCDTTPPCSVPEISKPMPCAHNEKLLKVPTNTPCGSYTSTFAEVKNNIMFKHVFQENTQRVRNAGIFEPY